LPVDENRNVGFERTGAELVRGNQACDGALNECRIVRVEEGVGRALTHGLLRRTFASRCNDRSRGGASPFEK
jgi:hypothetical protein